MQLWTPHRACVSDEKDGMTTIKKKKKRKNNVSTPWYTRTCRLPPSLPTYHLFDARTPRSRTRHRRTRVWPRVRVAATAAMLKADLYIIDRARPRLDGFRHATRTARTHVTYAVRLWARARARVTRCPAANKTRWFTHRQPSWGNCGSHVIFACTHVGTFYYCRFRKRFVVDLRESTRLDGQEEQVKPFRAPPPPHWFLQIIPHAISHLISRQQKW